VAVLELAVVLDVLLVQIMEAVEVRVAVLGVKELLAELVYILVVPTSVRLDKVMTVAEEVV